MPMLAKISSDPSRIALLARQITQETTKIDDFLRQHNLPQPSFDANGPIDLCLSPALAKSQAALIEATQELNDLVRGPREIIIDHTTNQLAYLQLIFRFDIARNVPIQGSVSYSDLARSLKLEESSMTRLLRYAIVHRIFAESSPGHIAHSPSSRLLVENSNMRDFVGACVEDIWPAALRIVDALVKWPNADQPNQTGFTLANNLVDDSFYSALAKDSERARRFGGAMSLFESGDGLSMRHLVANYPWADIGSGTVVDVGGSHGEAAFAIAKGFPGVQVVSQDLPATIETCKGRPDPRVTFMAHDFFEEQPVKGANVYLFRWILHNWPDKYCHKILRNLIPALRAGSKVVVMDGVQPPIGAVPNTIDRKLRQFDICMLQTANAKERSLEEYKSLFTEADARFHFATYTHPVESMLPIIAFNWVP